jgi:hypothetical protein
MTGSALAIEMALATKRETPHRQEQQEEIRMNGLMVFMNFTEADHRVMAGKVFSRMRGRLR